MEVDRPASVETIATVDLKYRYGAGGTWSRAGDILIGGAPGIIRVNVKTGAIAPVAKVKPGVTAHLWPVFLPDGEHFIFCTRSPVSGVQVFLGDLAHSGQASYLLDAESSYVAYAPDLEAAGRGFLVFAREASLMAQAVDTESGTMQDRRFQQVPPWRTPVQSPEPSVASPARLA